MNPYTRWQLRRFERLPVIHRWDWSAAEWNSLVEALHLPFEWKRAAKFSVALALGITLIHWAVEWHRGRLDQLKPLNEILLFTFAFGSMAAVSLVGYLSKVGSDLHPRAGDTPVCAITPDALRLGDRVFWYRWNKKFVVRVEPSDDAAVGPCVLLTLHYPMQDGHTNEVTILVPVPRAQPELASEAARTLRGRLGLEAL